MGFLIGAAEIKITPVSRVYLHGYAARDKISKGIHDDLYAKSIYIENNEEKVALVSLDLVGLNSDIVNNIRKIAKQKLNLDNVIIACTHTHSGPFIDSSQGKPVDDSWCSLLQDKIVDSINMSLKNKKQAKIGVKKTNVYGVGKNRRGNKEEVDPELGIIKVEDLEGKIIAILLNFTCHATVLDANNLLISADYPAYIYKFFSEAYPNAIILFTNGAAGDINIGYSADDSALGEKMNIRTFENAEKIGNAICNKTISSVNEISTINNGLLSYKKNNIKLPFKEKIPKMHELEEQMKERKEQINKMTNQYEKKKLKIKQIYDSIILRKIKNQYNDSGFLNVEIDILTIVDAILITIPGELFCKLGIKIKKIFSPKEVMIIGYANGLVGYLPTKEAFSQGGYEVETSIFSDEVGNVLVDKIKKIANS